MKDNRIFVSRIFPKIGIELLEAAGFVVNAWQEDRPMTQEELIEKAKDHNALFCASSDKIDKKFLNECSHLEIISQFAAGYDNIDIAEATRLGIPIGYTPDVLSEATADVAFGLMIAVARRMFHMHKSIIRGEWKHFRPTANLGMDLKNKTLGILGLGRIGFEMARKCKGAFNMDVLYHNRRPNKGAEKQLGAKLVDFDTMLQQSDVVSAHCALSNETRGIFDKHAFQKMKPSAIFINTARGLVHNETDLIDALNSGQLWGAGLDVTNPEPMRSDNPLLSMENVAVLPHIGSATVETRNEMARMAAINIIEFYKNNRIPNIVNPEVMEKE